MANEGYSPEGIYPFAQALVRTLWKEKGYNEVATASRTPSRTCSWSAGKRPGRGGQSLSRHTPRKRFRTACKTLCRERLSSLQGPGRSTREPRSIAATGVGGLFR